MRKKSRKEGKYKEGGKQVVVVVVVEQFNVQPAWQKLATGENYQYIQITIKSSINLNQYK